MRSMQKEFYRGWVITHHPDGPITGLWRGQYAGVEIGCQDRTRLADMIDLKIKDCPHLQKKAT